MKANEAPEKIQIHLIKNDDYWSIRGYSFLEDKQFGMTEYIRTDAFIDKACEWINLHIGELSDIYTRSAIRNEFLEDFRKAMEE